MVLERKAKYIGVFATFVVAIIVMFLVIFLWPKSFAYSDCGQCEMLGSGTNIERFEGLEVSAFGMRITAVINTKCYQSVTAEQKFSNGRIILKVNPVGKPISNHCICDRQLVFNLPKYTAKTVELYYEDRLIDKRSIIDNTLSDGLEFCESDTTYGSFCYYRAAFMKADASFCEKTAEPEKCKKELEEFLTLKCVAHDGQYCKSFFAEGK